jgi:hypothetical protein
MKIMETEMENFDPENYNIPRLMMRLKKSVFPGLSNVYDQLIKMGEVCDTMLDCEEDDKYMETYISYVTAKLQKHIIEKVGGRKQPGNKSRTFKDRKKMIEKGAVKKAIEEGKPSVDVQQIEKDIMKVQAEADIMRNFLRDYEQLQQIIKMERGEQISQENFLTLVDDRPVEIEDIERWKANLIGDILGAIEIIKTYNILEKNS